MSKVQMVLAVENCQYAELFIQYVQASEFRHAIQLKCFTQLESFSFYIQHEPRMDLVVADAGFTAETSSFAGPIVVLVEDGGGQELNSDWTQLAKYQPLDKLIDALLAQVGRAQGGGRLRRDPCEIISVYSAVAGMGKTTVALNMCKQWAMQGRRVFYWNQELLPSNSMIQHMRLKTSEGMRNAMFSKLLYYIQSNHNTESLLTQWSSFVMRDANLLLDYFGPCANAEELKELCEQDIHQLLELITATQLYDVIVIDLDSVWEKRTSAAFGRSHKVIWLLQDELLTIHKTELMLDYMTYKLGQSEVRTLLQRTYGVLNRYQGTRVNGLLDLRLSIQGLLPYIPAWQSLEHGSMLMQSAVFQAAILKLCAEEGLTAAEQAVIYHA